MQNTIKKVYFVTGTDTGVGKTYFSAGIVSYLRKNKTNACAFKPLETGCNDECEDAKILSKSSGTSISPIYSFKTPVAPSVASLLENRIINTHHLISSIKSICNMYSIAIIEGAGGIMVPIKEKYTFLDMAAQIDAEVIIVALNKLGVINHTLLTVEVCKCKGLNIKAVVINNYKETDESYKTNYETIKNQIDVPVMQFKHRKDLENIAEFLKN